MEKQGVPPTRAELLAAAYEAPSHPGVYLMRGEGDVIVYVGKAKGLRSRLSSYFQAGPHVVPRTELMVGQVRRFETILTETESEALILENNLIKKHKPKFNVRLKDDKTYPYLKISTRQDFPRIEWTRRVQKDGARYFGPFTSAGDARQVMELLNTAFKLRDCSDNTFSHRSRPCILFQIGKCSAPCVGKVSKEEYKEVIRDVVRVLEGKTDRFTRSLREKMEAASEREDFELAAEVRDQLRSLEIVTQTQVVEAAGSDRDRDVFGLALGASVGHGVVVLIRSGTLVAVKHFQLQNTDVAMGTQEALGGFVSQYYLALEKVAAAVERADDPDAVPLTVDRTSGRASEALLPEELEDADVLERALQIKIRTPRTAAEKQLAQVAQVNAENALVQAEKRAQGHGAAALEEVQSKLGLERLPARIECYDISNTQGDESVASRVVFIDGAPDKNLYRRYKIRTVEGPNDFAMMHEVLGRRFSNPDEALPDLVVVDGGKGQLAQAVAIFEELGVQGVALAGLAKARTESDFKSSEVKSSMERVFIPGRKNPISLYPTTAAFKLLTHVRDEAHRFAITYHRSLRDKKSLQTGGD